MEITFQDDYAVNLRTGEEYTPMKHCLDIKNDVQRNATAMRLAGSSNEQISRVVDNIVIARERNSRTAWAESKYHCTCNNWGPRFSENSKSMCCPGCWAWALDHHQDMAVNGVEPVTMAMIEKSTWGFNVEKLKDLKYERAHAWMHEQVAAGNRHEDQAGITGLPWI